MAETELSNYLNSLTKAFDDYHVKATISSVNIGPLGTYITITPQKGCSIQKIQNLKCEFQMYFKEQIDFLISENTGDFQIFILKKTYTPIPIYPLLEKLQSSKKEFENIVIGLGYCYNNQYLTFDLEKCSHLIVDGGTGSGKSNLVRIMLLSLIATYSPSEINYAIIDSKSCEYIDYFDLPYSFFEKPISAGDSFTLLYKEALSRLDRFTSENVSSIEEYNNLLKLKGLNNDFLPRIVIIVDCFSDFPPSVINSITIILSELFKISNIVGMSFVIISQEKSCTSPFSHYCDTRISFNPRPRDDFYYSEYKSLVFTDSLYREADYLSTRDNKSTRFCIPLVLNEDFAKVIIKSKVDHQICDYGEATEAFVKSFQKKREEEDIFYEKVKSYALKAKKVSLGSIMRKFCLPNSKAIPILERLISEGIVERNDIYDKIVEEYYLHKG